jgi:hypothetical protein
MASAKKRPIMGLFATEKKDIRVRFFGKVDGKNYSASATFSGRLFRKKKHGRHDGCGHAMRCGDAQTGGNAHGTALRLSVN